tara:strand:- start:114 stop:743 length:630 start_codon:yes stop_codon:yes gene_type:complete
MNSNTPWNIDREVPHLRKDYFENEFHDYNQEQGYEDRNVEWFKTHILNDALQEFKSRDNLLDVGCAGGYFTRLFKESFDLVHGVDFCDIRISHARQHETDHLNFHLADITEAEELKALGQQFDNIYSSAVIPHIPLPDKVKAFDNLAAISNPGAILVLYDGYSTLPTNINDEFVGIFNEKWLISNLSSWKLMKCNLLTRDVFKYVLERN